MNKVNDGVAGHEYVRLYPEQFDQLELEKWRLNEMARTGRPKIPTQADKLLEALSFVSVAATKDTQPYCKHLTIKDNFIVAFDGQIAAGYPIQEDLEANPNCEKFRSALANCGNSLVITALDTGRLAVKGDKLRAVVPCLPGEAMASVQPDPPLAVVDDRLKTALAVAGSLASEAGTRVLEASVLLEPNVCTGSNGAAIMQYWHGIDLPPLMVVPKIFAAAICRQKEKLVSFGATFGENYESFTQYGNVPQVTSITLYFEGGAWIKTQLYADKWPDVSTILNMQSSPVPVPKDLANAVAVVSEFDEHEFVYIYDGKVLSHMSDEIGAQFEVKGLVGRARIGNKHFKIVAPFITQIDFLSYPKKVYFFGENMRGCMSTIIEGKEEDD